MIIINKTKEVGRLNLTFTVQLPSIVSSRADRRSPKFVTVDKWGRGIAQRVCSVYDYVIVC